MKTWLVTLPLLCAAGMAMAQGAADDKAAVAEPAATQGQAQAGPPAGTAKARPRQGGDIRYCLERKSNKAIHGCAAKKRRQ